MKQKLISIIILILISSCSTNAPVPTGTLLPVSTNTPLPTELPTLIPTDTPFPTETSIPFDKMTDEQKLASAPPVEGLTNEFYRNNQIIRRDIEGKVVEIYKADTKETIKIPEGYTFFDKKQFPNSKSFFDYSGENCAPSFSELGRDSEGLLLEKALELPERFLWSNDVIGHAIATTGYDGKCTRLLYSVEPELSGSAESTTWGKWQGVVKLAYLTSLNGDASTFIYFP